MSFMQFDDQGPRRYFKALEVRIPKLVHKVAVEYVNNVVFEAKSESRVVLDQQFGFRDNSTRNYTNKAVTVQKAKRYGDDAIFGVKKPVNTKRTQFNREILIRQELGGKVRQLNSQQSGFRSQLVTQGESVHGKRTPRMVGKTASSGKKGSNKMRMARAIGLARRKGLRYAATPYGVYRVLKRKARKVTGYRAEGSITTPKRSFVKKVMSRVEPKSQMLLNKSVTYVFRKERAKIQRKLNS